MLLLCGAAMITSCSENIVNINEGWDADAGADGPPIVYQITASNDISTPITEVSLNQPIAIFGDNLWNITEILINDISVDLSQIYTRRHRLELIVPRQIPSTVTDNITIRTSLGEVVTPIKVTLPELTVDGFSNDFAADGDTVSVIGKNFDLYGITAEAITSFNGNQVEIFDVTDSSFKLQIPEGTPTDKTSYLHIITAQLPDGIDIPFREPGFPILTNDPFTWPGGWWPTGIINVQPDSEPAAPLFQWYVHIKNTYTDSWSYENIMITHFFLGPEAQDIVDNPQDYVVKLELLNPANTPLARYIRIGIAEMENEGLFYMWDPIIDGASINTMGEWKTLSLEVTDVFKGPNNTSSLKISDKPLQSDPNASYYGMADEWNNFKMAMQRELPGDIEFYFWNVRIVKKLDFSKR
jgi:hypothetical protein